MRVSTRTIRRDLQALQEAGFAVFDEGEENETKRWKLDAQPFRVLQDGLSVSDVAALYLSRALVEAMSGWPLAAELHSAFDKIERSLNERMREFLATLPQVLSAKGGPGAGSRRGTRSSTSRGDCSTPRAARRAITMRYFSASNNRAKNYDVQPYRLALANGGVYLVGWVAGLRRVPHVRDRAHRKTVGHATRRSAARASCPNNLFGQSMGVFWGEPERIELEFDARVAAVRARPRVARIAGRPRTAGRPARRCRCTSRTIGRCAAGCSASAPACASSRRPRSRRQLLEEFTRGCQVYEPGLELDPAEPAEPGPPLPLSPATRPGRSS